MIGKGNTYYSAKEAPHPRKTGFLCFFKSNVNKPFDFRIHHLWLLPLSIFTAALALRSRGLVIGSREKEREKEEKEEREEEEKNLQIAIRCLWDLFD